MSHVRVTAKIVIDDTGIKTYIPILMVEEHGQCVALLSVVDYLVANSQAKSPSWMGKLCQIVGLLIDYTDANHQYFRRPQDLFDAFAQRVYTGTIGEDGRDPSGLYWLPKRTNTAKQLLHSLSVFSDWLSKKDGAEPLNPWREATAHEARLNWAAFVNKSQRSFLNHLDSYGDAAQVAKQARNTSQRRTPTGSYGETKAFPDDRFMELLFVGFAVPGKQNCRDIVERYDWRGICISILLHWGGLRVSEPFHIWVHDAMFDPIRRGEALVRVYHPIDGAAPKDFRGPNGRYLPNREAYLRTRYPGYRPRTKETGNRRSGWKNPKLDDCRQNYMQVHWLPTGIAPRLFFQAWKLYMYQRTRAKLGAETHPFLFISFRGDARGEPYTIDAYRDAHAAAIRRIGLTPGKSNGTTHHGHRHAWGQRSRRAEVGSIVTQKGMHHVSPESQLAYTEPSISEITDALEKATATLDKGGSLPVVTDLDAWVLAERKEQKRYLAKGK
jgi:hypothetical protein